MDAVLDKIQIRDIDEGRDTYITVGCYRETHRLERMLSLFQKALTLARADECDADLIANLVSLHDHKGTLTVTWRDAVGGQRLRKYVEDAWADFGEHLSLHQTEHGTVFVDSHGLVA